MKKKYMAALAGLAAVFAVGGSLTYFNQNLEAVNILSVGEFDTTIHEDFTPGRDWEPGQEVTKKVRVANDGDVPAVARVWFTETWETPGGEKKEITSRKTDDENNLLPGESADEEPNDFMDIWQDNSTDGEIDLDHSVVEKNLNLGKDWEYSPKDGCFYYTGILEGGGETPDLLESIRLTEDADMGKMGEMKYYSFSESPGESDWVQFSPGADGKPVSEKELPKEIREKIRYFRSDIAAVSGAGGYSEAGYTLSVMAQTVQATRSAAERVFGPMALEAAREGKWAWNFLEEGIAEE